MNRFPKSNLLNLGKLTCHLFNFFLSLFTERAKDRALSVARRIKVAKGIPEESFVLASFEGLVSSDCSLGSLSDSSIVV